MPGIITLTLNPSIDKTLWVDKFVPEKKLKAKFTEDEAGGGGINISRAIKYLGGDSKAIFFSGGMNGHYLCQLLQQDNISFEAVSINANTRMNLMLIDESTQNEYRVGMEGAAVQPDETVALLELLQQQSGYEFLVVSGSPPPNISDTIYADIAKITEQHHAKLIIDTSGKPLQLALQEKIFLFKPNLNELSNLCGIAENATPEEIITAAQKLLQDIQCTAIAVSMGGSGALLVTKNECHYITPPKVEVKSTVGAGDCMVAGLTLALQEKRRWKEVLQMGVACGTAATLNSGKSLCNKKDVDGLLLKIKEDNC